MKKIIFRKLLIDCLTFFFLALFGISIIIWVFQAVNFLDIMIEDGRNYNCSKVYIYFTLNVKYNKIIRDITHIQIFLYSIKYVNIFFKDSLLKMWYT